MTNNEYTARIKHWRQSLDKTDRWCIIINADPDALACALTLQRIMLHRTHSVDIMRVNAVTRPDNLAMIRYLRIPVKVWQPEKASQYTHFAIVDSQPHHNKAFEEIPFSLIIDHHPSSPDAACVPAPADTFCFISPDLGAASTMLARFLHVLRIRPTARLATALLYGIRSDTATFERAGGDRDLRAWQWLSRYADNNLLRRIIRSEYLREWLPLFGLAFRSLTDCRSGAYAALNNVNSADLLVAVADFFTKVHGLRWIAVSGVVDRSVVVVVFRGDGGRDIGRLADACFHDIGKAGGHRNMGRAEFPFSAVPAGVKLSDFVLQRLQTRKLRRAGTALPQPVDG
ncbi:DHH family phosphoesterase [Candidatus Desulfovibrio trichonymphae]|uniref:DHH family phosphoesterase n=1 Tax=Candidatus Desulfovibrio trichonymphae TaxID=1725232 RepID=A0A1J1E199_9BACT|nr:DHH family phosphoesterase [Candidatus Desulfovibrio trichonymphae]BAV91651.1 DHH family phosphoesterase [Candidatus Desulfovibrio trichonymphae]GHU98422.1 DHH family phosphoesterase [Deltaproteobacteria bacterium]